MMAKPTVTFLVVPVPECRCFHCLRIAELVDVCQVLRADSESTRRDLLTEREGTTMLLAERKRMEANSLDLAVQLDRQRAEYWQATELYRREIEQLKLEIQSLVRMDASVPADVTLDSPAPSNAIDIGSEISGALFVASCGTFAFGVFASLQTWWGF